LPLLVQPLPAATSPLLLLSPNRYAQTTKTGLDRIGVSLLLLSDGIQQVQKSIERNLDFAIEKMGALLVLRELEAALTNDLLGSFSEVHKMPSSCAR
jgi:hypothetical protein